MVRPGSNVTIRDQGDTLTAGAGCSSNSDGTVTCSITIPTSKVIVNAGDGDDTINKVGAVPGDLRGESGNDTINGGPGPLENVLNGGPGNDTLFGGDNIDRVIGGPGADTMGGGGGTRDIVSYEDSGSGVTVDLDALGADDGAAGEGDTVLSDFEGITGSPFDDTLFGNEGRDILHGLGGTDTILGGIGDDIIVGGAGSDFLFGEGGADSLEAVDGFADTLNGSANTDFCEGDPIDVKSLCETG